MHSLRTRRERLAPTKTAGDRMGTSKFIDINASSFTTIDYGNEGRPHLVLLHGLNGIAPLLMLSRRI